MSSQTRHYENFIKAYSPEDPKFVGWSSQSKQETCHKVLISDLEGDFLDVGCGVGKLKDSVKGKYKGIDVNFKMIQQARNLRGENFEVIDILDYEEYHDYIIACGTFNIKHDNQYRYLVEHIEKMYELANKEVRFNLLSKYSLDRHSELFYYDPGLTLNIMKERWDRVSLRHDYLLDDFMVTIKK